MVVNFIADDLLSFRVSQYLQLGYSTSLLQIRIPPCGVTTLLLGGVTPLPHCLLEIAQQNFFVTYAKFFATLRMYLISIKWERSTRRTWEN